MTTELDEWLEEMVRSWTEVHKKSMTTLVLLRVIDELGTAPASGIARRFQQDTGWELTERGLYRTLRRLAAFDLLAVAEVPVTRTGAKRKDYSLSNLGRRYLSRLERAAKMTPR